MKIEDLIQLLNNRLREFKLSRDYARMSGDLGRMNVADKEILALEDTLYQLGLLVDTSKSAAVRETTLAEIMTDGSVAVLGEYDITSYATDPLHEEKVMDILSKMGVMDTVEKIDTYIHGKYVSSPVTGEMVMSASEAYDVDVRLMMAIMEQDSRFGTVGVAVRTLNPGNVGNDDGGNTRTYDSWQEGVTAVAEWLNRHRGSTIIPEISEEAVFEPAVTSTSSGQATSTSPAITPTTTTTTSTTTSTTVTSTTTPVTTTSTPGFATTTPATATPTPSTATSTPTTAGSTGSSQATSTPTTTTSTSTPTTATETSTPTTTTSTTTPTTATPTPSTNTSTSTPPTATPTTDTEAPVITIFGNNPAYINVGNTYADLGASVEDNVDNNLGIHTFVDGVEVTTVNLDTSTQAAYTITYKATDQAGNTGEATREVIVVEQTTDTATSTPSTSTPTADTAISTSSPQTSPPQATTTQETASTSSPQAAATTAN